MQKFQLFKLSTSQRGYKISDVETIRTGSYIYAYFYSKTKILIALFRQNCTKRMNFPLIEKFTETLILI